MMEFALGLSALLCSLVAGLVFTFAIVVMPGMRSMDDLAFLTSFKAMDRVIQNNQPVFILVWPGSAVVLLGSTVLGIWQMEGLDRVLLIVACVIYLFGVHLPTITINIPLMGAPALKEIKARFEGRWLRWNSIRTILATSDDSVVADPNLSNVRSNRQSSPTRRCRATLILSDPQMSLGEPVITSGL